MSLPASMFENKAALAKLASLNPLAAGAAASAAGSAQGRKEGKRTSVGATWQLEANWRAATITLPDECLAAIDEIHLRRRNPNMHD